MMLEGKRMHMKMRRSALLLFLSATKATVWKNPVLQQVNLLHTRISSQGRVLRVESSQQDGAWSKFCQVGNLDEALHAAEVMGQQGGLVTTDMVYRLLKFCIAKKDLAAGRRVHDLCVRSGFEANTFVGNHIIRLYASQGKLLEATQVFSKLQSPNSFAWSSIISAHVALGQAHQAVRLYMQMRQSTAIPDDYTLVAVLKACTSTADLAAGKQVHADAVSKGSDCNLFVGNTLIDMYAKCGSLEDARTVFDELHTRDVVTWNAMIGGYVKYGLGQEACKLYLTMQDRSISPDHVTFISVLKACGIIRDLQEGKCIHAHIQAGGLEAHGSVTTALIDMYAKCGSLMAARELFDGMPCKDTVAWSAIIAGYVQQGFGQEALRLYDRMQEQGVEANKVTLVGILKACGNLRALQQGKNIHAYITERGLEKDVFVASTLIDMYSRCGSLRDAHMVFDILSTRDVVVWNTMIAGYAQHQSGDEVLQLFERMMVEGLTPDKTTFVSILKACGSTGALQVGERLHAQILERGYGSDAFVGGALMDMYVKCGNLATAHSVFNKLPRKNVVTWNILIAGYGRQGLGQKALDLFKAMQQEGVGPDNVTFVSMLKACGSIQAVKEGKQIHAMILSAGLEKDLFVSSALMDMYAKWGFLEEAREVFDGVHTRDIVIWNAMLAAYLRRGLGLEAIKLYVTMRQTGVIPNNVTYVTILNACSSIAAIQEGQQIHAEIVENRVEMDLAIGNALVDMYATCGSLADARNTFDRLPTKDAGTWSAMLAGYSQQGLPQEVLALYRAMQQKGMTPANVLTFVSILKACGNVGAIQEGKQVHAQIVGRGLETDQFVASTLIDMYTKCGNLNDAQAVFEKLPTKDVVAWTALIHGYGQHNDCEAAMHCFDEMRHQGVVPDAATFTSLLVACSHVSLVNEGKQYFTMMTEQYCITPTIEHYTSMVDLLSRSGHLDEAHNLLLSMLPSTPHAAGWRCLLSGCKIHSNTELGRLCFNRLVELEPEQAAGYVLMSNIYANAGRWEDVEIIQNLKKGAGAQKKPAMASIEINKQVHEFIVGDKGFLQTDAVYGKLKTLSEEMKDAGHIPETDLVLKPVSEKDKEDSLCGHAEKLAIAFGLLHTPEGTNLLVVKNLRMCNDCHTGTKILSRMEGREIVVRDAHRVHRFKDGVCSCKDHH